MGPQWPLHGIAKSVNKEQYRIPHFLIPYFLFLISYSLFYISFLTINLTIRFPFIDQNSIFTFLPIDLM